MTGSKTDDDNVDPAEFIAAVEHDIRRGDAKVLLELMGRVTGYPAKMWGPTIVGFGRYHYKYESGREGDSMVTGFSPRKANLVVYVMPGYGDFGGHLEALGKHRLGKSCLYINKLADIDLAVLESVISAGVAEMQGTHETWSE